MLHRRTARGAWLLLAALGGACARAQPRPDGPVARPPVLVVVIVDQLAAWVADERWPALPADGGFARLRREGLTVRDMRYAHATTETAPGHAALFTGAVPRVSGIFANEIIPSPGADSVSILTDPSTQLIPLPGRAPQTGTKGSSLRPLRVETLADVLVGAHADALVLSASLKDRAALFGGGRHPTLAVWFDPERESFVTSTAFPSPPATLAFAAAFDHDAIVRARAEPWTPLDGRWVAAHAETPDAQPGEGDYQGLGTTFPHAIRSGKALRASPAGDRALLGVALAFVDAAAQARKPTLLTLSLSSNDYVSHVFGPHSYEAWDELLRLDRGLGELLVALDRAFGPDGYAVMLTADHGSAPLPELSWSRRDPWCHHGEAGATDVREQARGQAPKQAPKEDRWQRVCGFRHMLSPKAIAASLEPALSRKLGPGPWVAGVAAPWVFLTEQGKNLPPLRRARLVATANRTLRASAGLERVLDARAEPAQCPPIADESVDALICRATVPDAAADLFLLPRRGDFFDPHMAEGHGASHGSPYLYDRAVPLVVRAPGRVAAGTVVDGPLPYSAFTRTAAALLGIRPPADAAPGPDLTTARR
jgi:predicted AlkP superfamily pyrophosphatase or phosphodiesterase